MSEIKVPMITQEGKTAGEMSLDASVFAFPVKPGLVHGVAEAMRSNLRQGNAHTKTRGEVRGGGRKPWRQKGTGRARHGSRRSPIWKGGGVTFGPRNTRNWHRKVNRQVRQSALRMVLSDRAASGHLKVLVSLPHIDKTKGAASFIDDMRLATPAVLVVPQGSGSTLMRAFRNISAIKVCAPSSLTLLSLLAARDVVFTKESAMQVSSQYIVQEKKRRKGEKSN